MPRLIRLLISLLMLGFIAERFGAGVLERLEQVDWRWLVAGLLITVAQVLLSAWRWRFTATRLGLSLRRGVAIREYYLATLINQVLPGGVVGDAQRAWRHSHDAPRRGPAFQAVVIERFSGQLAMVGLALGVWGYWPPGKALTLPDGWLSGAVAVIGGAGTIIVALALISGRRPHWLIDWWQALRYALLAPRVLPVQLIASIVVAISYIGVYACCVLSLGPESSPGTWLPLIPLVLFAMLIPASIAGWGLREGAAAVLWPLAGLPVAEGVSAAVLYGALSLVASTPGLITLLRR
ncbi:lysylphosphatidylglycerol synthase transmembrane domain-containing protein [Spiribacter vilamensis]|uniref:Uncharacterized membrane protein YbhN (UPF0104 family) n=1 Tax=Spiribacter vilamensis TaxID=531306 RepID=A0A4Q8CYK7_9GAMM|nr:lysylphosphatidylglycerol synthase transmembrane domain-containing protein [Spiribacter vilamensis]RZU98069.1 uncharacterized membrane protein YbhN (UPF0104 family) [Spiribacter vilamensis]